MHDVITVGVPVLAILFGILLNQRGLDKLEDRMDTKFDQVSGRMDRLEGRMDHMQADLSRFYQILGEHNGKIEMLTKK